MKKGLTIQVIGKKPEVQELCLTEQGNVHAGKGNKRVREMNDFLLRLQSLIQDNKKIDDGIFIRPAREYKGAYGGVLNRLPAHWNRETVLAREHYWLNDSPFYEGLHPAYQPLEN